MTHMTKECDTCNVALLDLFLLHFIFSKKVSSVVGRSFLKADNVLSYCSSCGKC